MHTGKKKTLASLQENTVGERWIDLGGGIKRDTEVVLVASMCERDSLAVCVCVWWFAAWALSLMPDH